MGSEDLDLRLVELHAAVVGEEPVDALLARVADLAVATVPGCTSASASLHPGEAPGDDATAGAPTVTGPQVLSVPLRWGGRLVGALELRRASGAFSTADAEAATRLAEQAAVAVANALEYRRTLDLVDNLRSALGSRDLIGQAKGVLMARHGISADQAFELLRRRSQTENVKLRDIARQMVEEANAASGDTPA